MAFGSIAARDDAAPPTAQRTIVLHDHGDVTLLLGGKRLLGEKGEQQPVLVSSTTMRLASPVWSVMFNDRWAESEAREIDLADDDVHAMLIVLRIAHLKFNDIPQKRALTFSQLVELAVVCDKYDLVKIVRPFLNLHEWDHIFKSDILRLGYHEGLFIAWTFGYEDTFNKLSRHLVWNISPYVWFGFGSTSLSLFSTPKSRTDWRASAAGSPLFGHLPPGILESIVSTRKILLQKILVTLYATLDKASTAETCTVAVDKEQCRATLLGSLILAYQKLGLLPDRTLASDYSRSIGDIYKGVNDMQLHTYESVVLDEMRLPQRSLYQSAYTRAELEGRGLRSHAACAASVNLKKLLEDTFTNIPSPVEDSHRNHIRAQAKK